jgi:hypothetical protein
MRPIAKIRSSVPSSRVRIAEGLLANRDPGRSRLVQPLRRLAGRCNRALGASTFSCDIACAVSPLRALPQSSDRRFCFSVKGVGRTSGRHQSLPNVQSGTKRRSSDTQAGSGPSRNRESRRSAGSSTDTAGGGIREAIEGTGIPLRGADERVCVHAKCRGGQRPPPWLLSSQPRHPLTRDRERIAR